MGAARRGAAVAADAHGDGATGEHALNAEAGPRGDGVAEFFEELVPAVIDSKEQLCGARDIHAAEYKTGLRTCNPPEPRSGDARPARALRSQDGGYYG